MAANLSTGGVESDTPIRVLHVDDDPARVRLSATLLEEHIADVEVHTSTDPEETVARLDDVRVDCIVSDYDMPEMNGLEFLESVRERSDDLPFILFTGKGSEEIASKAISAGVTDYLQKGGGPDQYAVLANRVENVVAQYRAERTAEAYQEHVNTVYERVTDAFFALDDEWRFTHTNGRGEDLLDRTEDELLGEVVWDEFPEAVNSRFEDEYRAAMRTQESTTFEAYYPPLDTLFEMHAYPSTEGLSVFFRDITDENRIRKELHREKELLERVFDTSPIGILVVDVGGGISRANERAVDLLEVTEEEIKDRTYDSSQWNVTDEEGNPLPDDEHPIREVFERGVSKMGQHVGYESPSGEWSLLSVSAAPIYSGDEGISRVVITFKDVTDMREHQRELERQNERLEEFVSVVSHDLRNPLDVAQVQAELARREADSEHIDEVVLALDRMETLVTDLLTLAKQGQVVSEPEPVPLGRVVENAWSTAGATEATLETEDDLPTVLADGSRLRELLENLLGNAVTHAGDDALIRVESLPDGFAVEDDGPGIPEGERERVFEYGYSTEGNGTGFGLPIVRRIARAHDWTVAATEGDAGGARFEVRIVPISEE